MEGNTTGGGFQQGGFTGPGRPLTFGEKAVGLTFNPGGDPQVTAIKAACAALIDQLNDIRATCKPGEQARMLSLAITDIQSAQMWAVKAVTWQF